LTEDKLDYTRHTVVTASWIHRGKQHALWLANQHCLLWKIQ